MAERRSGAQSGPWPEWLIPLGAIGTVTKFEQGPKFGARVVLEFEVGRAPAKCVLEVPSSPDACFRYAMALRRVAAELERQAGPAQRRLLDPDQERAEYERKQTELHGPVVPPPPSVMALVNEK